MSDPIKKTDTEIFYPEGKAIIIRNEKIVIYPFVISENRTVLKIIINGIKKISLEKLNISSLSPLEAIETLIEFCGEDLIRIYEIALKKDAEWINKNITLKDEINILSVISEVNDFSFLVKRASELINKTKILPA